MPLDDRLGDCKAQPVTGALATPVQAHEGFERLLGTAHLHADAVIRHVAEGPHPLVFMLWGAHAQGKRAVIPADRGHLVLCANHPSPLSALRPPVPFIGCGHFGLARVFRERQVEG